MRIFSLAENCWRDDRWMSFTVSSTDCFTGLNPWFRATVRDPTQPGTEPVVLFGV